MSADSPIKLSIVIPVYNGAAYIGESLSLLADYFGDRDDLEVIAVNDGSSDNSAAVLESLPHKFLKTIILKDNLGKFGALKEGVKASRGNCVIFTDADIPFDLEALSYIEDLVTRRGLQIVIGDRALQNSTYALETSPARQLGTFLFSAFVRMFVAGGLFDTQCGLKGFQGDVARALFPLVGTNGFSGDVELLYIALKYNLEVKRIPVRLRNSGSSTVRLMPHGIGMLRNIATLKFRWMRGDFASDTLAEISRQAYWNK